MGIPNQFNDIIKRQLNVNAAWLPVTNDFQLGDYGIIANGVFTKMGNIKEFSIAFERGEGPEASLDFISAEAQIVNFSAGAEVNVIPAASIDAKITVKFGKEGSFMVKAPKIQVSVIRNVNQVAKQLMALSEWKRKWKVVFQTYMANDTAVISTIAKDTDVTFSGDVNALKELKFGSVGLSISATKQLGLDVHGKAGVIGLGLFKLRLIGGGPVVLTKGKEEEDVVDYNIPEEDDL